jgi:hypothetical protein
MTVNHGVLGSSPRGGAKASEKSEVFIVKNEPQDTILGLFPFYTIRVDPKSQ